MATIPTTPFTNSTDQRVSAMNLRPADETHLDRQGGGDEALAVVDGETVVHCSPGLLRLFGGNKGDFLGKPLWEITADRKGEMVPAESVSRENVNAAYAQGHQRVSWVLHRPDDKLLNLDVSLTRIDLPDGQRLIVTFRDVTEIVAAERQLRERLEFHFFLPTISNALDITDKAGLDSYINDSLRQIGERYDLDMVRLWWSYQGVDRVWCSHDWARSGNTVAGYKVAIDRVSWANKIVWSGRGYHVTSLDEYPAEAELDRKYTEQEGIKSLFVTPILLGGKVHGAASYSTTRAERDWPQQTIEELELLTRVLGTAWKREESIRMIRESEAELSRSQQIAKLGTFVESAVPGTTLTERYGDLKMSREACAIFGLESGSETLEAMASRIHPDDLQEAFRLPVQADGKNTSRQLKYRVIRPDGTEIRAEEWGEVEFNASGEPVRWFGTVQDVTEKWAANERLRQQVRFQKRLVRMSQVFMSGSDENLDDKLEKALQNLGEAYGIDRVNILNVDFDAGAVYKVHQWATEDSVSDTVKMELSSAPWSFGKILAGQSCEFAAIEDIPEEAAHDREFYRALGIKSRFNVPVYVDSKVAGSVSFLMMQSERDWSEQVKNELSLFVRVVVTAWQRVESIRKLEENEAELLRSQRVAHVGSYAETALPGTTLEDSYGESRLSDEARSIFQIEPGEESVELIAARIHPDDREHFQASIKGDAEDGMFRTHDYRVVHADGSIIYVEDRLEIDRNEAGEITRVFGTVMDVTSRVESNLQLKEAMNEIERLKDQLQDENIYLRKEIRSAKRQHRLVGENEQFASAMTAAEKVAPTDVTVLILGETGTGKELIAREVHAQSTRSDSPLISVNCAALSSELIESELFGHEAGAFTGADKQRKGRFEIADAGTLFLDEIGDLPAEVQAKILRALQTGEFERLGGMETLKVDVRLITATNRNLQQMVAAGTFRADLFYRINSFPINVPALRERRDDIALLANHFVQKHAVRLGKRVQAIDPEMIRHMEAQSWPGNVRELEGFIQRALIAASGTVLNYSDSEQGGGDQTVPDLDAIQQEHIVAVLDRCNWVVGGKKGAASLLGVPPSTLRSRMKKLGINRPS